MSLAERYYFDGYLKGKFIGDSREALAGVLHELVKSHPKSPYVWEQKYENTLDLRPSAHDYHPSIMQALFDAGVPKLLSDVIAPDLVLMHTQIRRSFPGPSYMDWHRDTYRYKGVVVGNVPPVHKIIFYPKLGDLPEPKLKLAVGSHRQMFDDRDSDMRNFRNLSRVDHWSSDDEFLLFDTSIMHGVIPDEAPQGSIRVIYSFIRENQFEASLADQKLHLEQAELYRRMR